MSQRSIITEKPATESTIRTGRTESGSAIDVTSLFRAGGVVSLGPRKDPENERQAVYDGRKDSDIARGGSGRAEHRGDLPGGKHFGCNLPSVEETVWAHGSERSPAAQGAGA